MYELLATIEGSRIDIERAFSPRAPSGHGKVHMYVRSAVPAALFRIH
jgi:hypothetical protein